MTSETVKGNFSPSGTNPTLEQITVPAGEIWYVDLVQSWTDGAGTDSTLYLRAGIGSTAALDAIGSNLADGARGVQMTLNASTASSTTSALGAYAEPGEEIRLSVGGDGGGGGTIYYMVQMRQTA